MEITLKLENERTLGDIERLRGELKPGEFVLKCFVDGLHLANMKSRSTKLVRSKDGGLCFGLVEERFRGLSKDLVRQAVRRAERKDPIYVEVRRLVDDYRRIVEQDQRENGREMGDLPPIVGLAPIQIIALEIAVNSLTGTSGLVTVKEMTKH